MTALISQTERLFIEVIRADIRTMSKAITKLYMQDSLLLISTERVSAVKY